MSQLPERLETYLCSFVTQSVKYAFEVEGGAPGDLLATTLLLWARTAGTENIRCATVNAMCGLITANEGAREKISSNNGMQIVADVLHRSKTENGVSACAQTLAALANLSQNRRVLCCHRYAVTDLVQACETRSEATSRKCVGCLKEISMEHSCHQMLLRCSALEKTSVFLRKRPADAASKLVLILWHNLSCSQSSRVRFGPHLDILCVLLGHTASAMQSLALCVLCNALLHPNNCEHFGRQTVFKAVMGRLIPSAALGVATKACYTLQNALQFSAHCRQIFGEQGGVSLILRLLLLLDANDLRESALTVVLMTIHETPSESRHVLSSVTQLLEILSYDLTTYEVMVRILKALSFIAKTDDVTRQKIIAVNSISIVVQLFEIPETLGNEVTLKFQKDGDRFLALKIATAFLALLSRSKKALARLVSQGALAMMISILAEHCNSALPESIVVNASIFLANFSADRQGLKDVISTCGIPVILKSAIISATSICSLHKETNSPHRMRKFTMLRGLPRSPIQSVAGPASTSADVMKNIEGHAQQTKVALENEKSSQELSEQLDQLEILVKCKPDSVQANLSEKQQAVIEKDDTLKSASIQNTINENNAPAEMSVSQGTNWLNQIGVPLANQLMKKIIGESVKKFQLLAEGVGSNADSDAAAPLEVHEILPSLDATKQELAQSTLTDIIREANEEHERENLENPNTNEESDAASNVEHEDAHLIDRCDESFQSNVEKVDWEKSVDEEDVWDTEAAHQWSLNLTAPSVLLKDDPCAEGTALTILVKCVQNLCSGEPAARKQLLENGANSFLIACIIPITGTKTSQLRPLEDVPVAVPYLSDDLGLSIRLDAAGALSNLALSEQSRQMLMATGIFEVLEEVGAWDQGAGEQQAGYNGSGGGRLLREPRELIDRLASFVRTMCGEDKCRRRVRSSSKLQALASVMPIKLSEYCKYQDSAMQHQEVFCTSSIYSTKFIPAER